MRPLLCALILLSATACAERVIEDTAAFDPALDPDLGPAQDPDDDDAESSGGSGSWPAPRVIFVNFDGPTLVVGPDDSRTNTSSLARYDFEQTDPYGASDNIPVIMALLRDAWAPMNVVFTTERPGGGDYTMVVVTPTNPWGIENYGVALIGCDDSRSNSVVAAFSDDSFGPRSPDVIAGSISRQLGFSFGLDPVENLADFMARGLAPGNKFVDECGPVEEGYECGDTDLCPPGTRNSRAQLIALTYEN